MRARSALLLSAGLLLFLRPAHAEPQPAMPIGSMVENLRFKDIRFLVRSLDDFGKRKAFVVVFVDAGCPVASRYLPTLNKLDRDYRGKGVQFLAVNSSDATIQEVAAQAVEHEVEFPFLKDIDGKCASALGVERTPEVVILDAERAIRYRGRIDDQYRPGGSRSEPTRRDLQEALDEVLAGKPVAVSSTPVDGCPITRADKTDASKVTYAEHIAAVVHKNCAVCHRPGTAAPFSLTTFEEVRKKGRAIAEVVADGQMPPWYADPAHDGVFNNQRKLTAVERDSIIRWVKGGMERGDESKMPKLEPYPEPRKDGWLIGEPDLILETAVHELPAEGLIDYKNVVLPHAFLHETWIQAIQILPDNPRVVHHCNMVYGSVGHGIREANFITGYVPGNETSQLGEGIAFRLPPVSALGLQIHYVTTGKPEKCRIKVGLRFARGTVHKQVRFVLMDSTRFAIPAQSPHHPIHLTQPLEHDAVGVAIFAHMHLRGKAMVFRAQPPEGEPQTLLSIPNYNFGWQLSYLYQPGKLKLPKGTRLECEAIFDNSPFNPYNPDPDAVVRYGRQTRQEMINGFFFYVDEHEDLKLEIDPKTGRAKREE
jgi:mono/diheme cytochrome c family protein